MIKNSKKTLTIMKYVSLGLMVVLFALQFVPYWEGVSIAQFLAFPEEVTTTVKEVVGGQVNIDDIVVVVVCQLIGSLIGVILYLKKKPGTFAGLVPMIAGGAGVLGCLLQPSYQAGSLWLVVLAVSAVLLVVGTISLVLSVIRVLIGED